MIADDIYATGWRRCLRNHAAFCDFAHHTSPVDLKAQHGPASLVNGRNWAYSQRISSREETARWPTRETTACSKSVGLLVILRHSKPAISQILDACRYSNVSAPRRGDSKIFRGSGAVENPAPHRMAVLECFRRAPIGGGGKKSTPQTHRPTDFLQTDSTQCPGLPGSWF
jgi:hypothetical protein